ncbi:hypothetical protein CONPUDRAFT_78144 [Coniophora puteana RWD-64-598 SS2]|uniref:Uncharacterized protein n=1 Tax=Coniophora puteana (strain RWD-64-598) TaxID=741705 RepID=R7SEK9_CONPW|nr:uncharacterized protein CONPUDRAFT_78144 [Coniophora puteana RWD-64-598 SS2]EIW74172.1 hypothetical protein CONPUDRAFT_78144 [Coniophora puteana RWD-64-598 SS2]
MTGTWEALTDPPALLPILHLATRGRILPLRLWTLAIHLGWSDLDIGGYGLPGVYYGEVDVHREQFSQPTPYMADWDWIVLGGLVRCRGNSGGDSRLRRVSDVDEAQSPAEIRSLTHVLWYISSTSDVEDAQFEMHKVQEGVDVE